MVPAVVRVAVAIFQTSDAKVPNVVRERVPLDQTLSGIVAAREVEAVRTVASVWVLMVEIAVVSWLFVFAFTAAVLLVTARASEVEAEKIAALVFELILPFNELEAFPTTVFVLLLTAVVPVVTASAKPLEAFATTVFVFALTFAARDVDAVAITLAVLAFTFALRDDEALPTTVPVFELTDEIALAT